MAYDRKELLQKWQPLLEHESIDAIGDVHRRNTTAILLENQERELQMQRQELMENAPTNSVGSYPDTGGIAKFDPVLISLVRRSIPKLIAYDICGVQPLQQPTGLIFAQRAKYTNQAGAEALFNEADTAFSGTGAHAGTGPTDPAMTTGRGMATSAAEALGTAGGGTFGEMAMTIEKVMVEAKSRALKAEYSQELAQDMKTVHGLDAESELATILSRQILNDINREVVRSVYISAKVGAQVGTAVAGTFDLDVDANGRWLVEKFKGLMFQVEREANQIAYDTRMGRGNFIMCSSDVASALSMAGVLDYNPALSNKLEVNVGSTTFAGVLNSKYKVFVDPYLSSSTSADQFLLVGYKGESAYDAGMFYCPYVPLQMFRAVDPGSFQPKIGFKTRYGLVANPFVTLTQGADGLTQGKNYYYRKVKVTNLM